MIQFLQFDFFSSKVGGLERIRQAAVQIYEFHIFISYLLHPRVYYKLTIDQLPVGLIAQLDRALHRYCRGHGFDSPSGLVLSTA